MSTGLPLGRGHTFTASVCNSAAPCATSNAVSVTVAAPAPDPGSVTLTCNGRDLRVSWTAVGNPVPGVSCSVAIERSGSTSGGMGPRRVKTGSGHATVRLRTAGSYQAVKRCTWPGGAAEAPSSVLHVG